MRAAQLRSLCFLVAILCTGCSHKTPVTPQQAQAPQLGGRQQGVPGQEAVMSEADLFRQYAKEAMHESAKATSENEKQVLWAAAN